MSLRRDRVLISGGPRLGYAFLRPLKQPLCQQSLPPQLSSTSGPPTVVRSVILWHVHRNVGNFGPARPGRGARAPAGSRAVPGARRPGNHPADEQRAMDHFSGDAHVRHKHRHGDPRFRAGTSRRSDVGRGFTSGSCSQVPSQMQRSAVSDPLTRTFRISQQRSTNWYPDVPAWQGVRYVDFYPESTLS
jgi:hypothetical protein